MGVDMIWLFFSFNTFSSCKNRDYRWNRQIIEKKTKMFCLSKTLHTAVTVWYSERCCEGFGNVGCMSDSLSHLCLFFAQYKCLYIRRLALWHLLTRVGNVSDTCQKVFRHVSKDAVMAKTEKSSCCLGNRCFCMQTHVIFANPSQYLAVCQRVMRLWRVLWHFYLPPSI